jgi:hypothetical protein
MTLADDDWTRTQRRMVALLDALTPVEGYNLTALPDVRFLRSNRPLARTPVLYDPGIVIVCQGRKRGFLGDEVYLYDAQHYLAVAVPVPFSMETDASEAEPMLAIYFRLDFNLAADLMLQLDERHDSAPAGRPKGMMSTPLDARLGVSVLRFLEAMSVPLEAEMLGPALVREIYFRVLTGEQGASMRAALTRQGQFGKISKDPPVLRRSAQRRTTGDGGEHERAVVPRALQGGDQHFADAISEVDKVAPGASADGQKRCDGGRRVRAGGL